MQLRKLRLWIANWLDILQRSLIKDQFSKLSRTELIERLLKLDQRYKNITRDLNPQIIRLLEDVEAIARGDLSVRTDVTDKNSPEFAITAKIHDSLNRFLDDLCELLAELPEGSPLKKKYQLPEKFYKGLVTAKNYSEMQLSDHEFDEFERFMGKLLKTLDDAEEIGRGSLFKRIGHYPDEYDDPVSLYADFYALVDCFNLILDDMQQAVGHLPQGHPLRRKYTLNAPNI